MQAYEVRDASGIDGLELVERPILQPGPGEVLVRIRAVTLNYRDLLTVKGGYGSRQKFPLVPLSDAAGIVEAVGTGRLLDNGTKVPMELKVGDKILYAKYAGNEFKVDEIEYLIISEKDVLAIVASNGKSKKK